MDDAAEVPEPHRSVAERLNWLRAGVLGANDGIVSVAAVVVGVAAATDLLPAILVAGGAAWLGGAVSMALGEYVSVSSQRDSERALIEQEKRELREEPEEEFAELVAIYRNQGLSEQTAEQVAQELTDADALGAHLSAELHLDQDALASPWHAAGASAVAFLSGGLLPLLAVLVPSSVRIPLTVLVVLAALAGAGALGAWLGGSRPGRPMLRVVVGGAIALAVTFGLGSALSWFGITG